MTDDIHVLAQVKQLNPEALGALHAEFYEPVVRYIQFKVGDERVVEDLSSEVFVRVVEAVRRGNTWRDSPRGWIMGIARHVVADHYRRREKSVEVALSEDITATEENDPVWQTMLSERKQVLLRAMALLTEEQHDIVSMRFIKGISIADIATATGKTPGAVRALQHRALQTLAMRLQHFKEA